MFRASCVDDKASELIAVTCSAPYLVTAQWERTWTKGLFAWYELDIFNTRRGKFGA